MPQPLRSIGPRFFAGDSPAQPAQTINPPLMSMRARIAKPMPVQSPAFSQYRGQVMNQNLQNPEQEMPLPAQAPAPMMRNQGYQPINPAIAQMLMDRSQMRGRLGGE